MVVNQQLWIFLNSTLSLGMIHILHHQGIGRKLTQYACAEGGAQLPIAHTLCLPEPTKNPERRAVSFRFVPVLRLPSDLEIRAWKETEEERIIV